MSESCKHPGIGGGNLSNENIDRGNRVSATKSAECSGFEWAFLRRTVEAVATRAAKDLEGTAGVTDLRTAAAAVQAVAAVEGVALSLAGTGEALEGKLEAEAMEIPSRDLVSTCRPP
jgi:hypothetical protein